MAWLATRVLVGTYYSEEQHPISRALAPALRAAPAVSWCGTRALTIVASLTLVAVTVPVYFKLGSEFMPPLR